MTDLQQVPEPVPPLPVRCPWFERREVSGGLSLYVEPAVHRWFRANIWYLRGRELDLLVDAGMGIASLKAALREHGDRPVLAIATHGHIDHMGGIHEFDRRAIHEADAAALHDDESVHLSPFFRAQEGAVTALPHEGWRLEAFTTKASPATRLLHEGDRIELGDRDLTVVHLPGHSPGSIGLLDERDGTFFSGDAIYDGQLLDDLPRSDPAVYEATMTRLGELPIDTVHGGHGPDFDRPRMLAIAEDYLQGRREPGCPGGH